MNPDIFQYHIEMGMSMTAMYAGGLALVFVFLSLRIILKRMKHGAGRGDAGQEDLARAIRAHGNFIEYVPLFLIMLAVSEMNGMNPPWFHGIAIVFVLGRLLHIVAITKDNLNIRKIGMVLTFIAMIKIAIFCLTGW